MNNNIVIVADTADSIYDTLRGYMPSGTKKRAKLSDLCGICPKSLYNLEHKSIDQPKLESVAALIPLVMPGHRLAIVKDAEE